MQSDVGTRTLRHLVSPYGLATSSLLLFIASWLFPPALYASIMGERDLLFLDPQTFVFYVLCVAGFAAGVWLTYPRQVPLTVPKLSPRVSSLTYLLLPLAFGLLGAARALLETFRQTPNLAELFLAQQAANLKGVDSVANEVSLATAAPVLVSLGWWALWRFWQLRMTGWRAHVVRFAIGLTVLTTVVSSILLISRNLIMEMVGGFVVLFILHRQAEGTFTRAFAARVALFFVFGIAALFGLFSYFRGTSSFEGQLYLLLGYTAASYNRLAALLGGQLRYPFAGHGVYLSPFVSFNEAFHRLIPVDRIFHWPGFFEEWTSEFGAVERSGLNGSLIFLGAFGFLFCDIGWFTPLMLLVEGLLYGLAWKAMRRSSVFGVVLYPYFGYCVLFWFGTNLFFDSSIVPFLKFALYLFVYEKLVLSTVPEESPSTFTLGPAEPFPTPKDILI